MDEEQETLRLIADMLKDIYVLKASLLRPSKDETKQIFLEILAEETYRQVEADAISIISSLEDEDKKNDVFEQVRNLSVPTYSNIIAKKRKIANKLIDQ